MKSQYVLPAAIIIFGLIVAGALFLAGNGGNANGATSGGTKPIPAATASDHIYGNPNAPVKIVEYADLECPYCKQFETTMDQLMAYYGPSGNVAWVFRPFPLKTIHSKAPEEAEAAECAADQGGNAAFFKYIDKLYSITPSENGLDLSQLPVIAQDVGLNVDEFNQCLSSNKYATQINDDYNAALAEGLNGTPHIAIMANNQVVASLDGNQPYDSMRAAVDAVLQSLNLPTTGSSTASTTPAASTTSTAPAGGETTLPAGQ
ncbi:MAG: DsbA family protein [Minisyncoccia bacterium]